MHMVKCPECGLEINDSLECCSACGYPISKQIMKTETLIRKERRGEFKIMRSVIALLALLCFCISGIFFSKGYNVKNEYYNSEEYPILNENAYVGGDAYNYIINGTYFTGYSVIASAALICGVMLTCSYVNITIKIKV